jgi:hypothetical protein
VLLMRIHNATANGTSIDSAGITVDVTAISS